MQRVSYNVAKVIPSHIPSKILAVSGPDWNRGCYHLNLVFMCSSTVNFAQKHYCNSVAPFYLLKNRNDNISNNDNIKNNKTIKKDKK